MATDRVTEAHRREAMARAANRCEYCRSPGRLATQRFTVDHVLPISAGGKTALDNLAWACSGCNGHTEG
ncbi:MAG: HNH endonuclease [Chloroflexi bacterium]|nr:HNH endonuclease [Chloroflexota bacterium]